MTEVSGFILVVDDQRLNRAMLSHYLTLCGFTVALAASGREALESIEASNFDLILLDQIMPDMNGTEVLRMLRATYPAETLPIIMVTAVADSEKIAEALAAGANDYVTKPIDYPVTLARIRSQLLRKQAEASVREREERYALVAKASRDGLWDWNLKTGQVYYSARWMQMLGLGEEESAGTSETWFSRILSADRRALHEALHQHLDGQSEVLHCSYRMLDNTGSVRWMSCRGIAARDQHGSAVRIAGSQCDVTEEKTEDALTGLPNRLRLLGDLECLIERPLCSASAMTSYGLLSLNLDGFKQIYDSLGHQAGDKLLKCTAGRVELFAAEYGARHGGERAAHTLAARTGGGEFAILLKENATLEALKELAAGLQRAMKLPIEVQPDQIVHCNFSIGIALASGVHTLPEDLLYDANLAVSTAKGSGRCEIAVFEPQMYDRAREQLDLANDIRLAVKRNELVLAYQPKVNLDTGLTYGVEALLRWNHPARGLLQPGAFIQIAEETDTIIEIGSWVRLTACAQVRAWHELFRMQTPLELSVNLSPCEFKLQSLVADIGHTLAATRFPTSAFHLEITEGLLLEDMDAVRLTLHSLKKLGLNLDLDDFGSGYSSLRYLHELPFDLLKIDRYFTQALNSQRSSSSGLIQSILSMAQGLGMKVVAEGIETREHSMKLQQLGCSLGQGFYYSEPLGVDAMEALLAAEYSQALNEYVVHATGSTGSPPYYGEMRPKLDLG